MGTVNRLGQPDSTWDLQSGWWDTSQLNRVQITKISHQSRRHEKRQRRHMPRILWYTLSPSPSSRKMRHASNLIVRAKDAGPVEQNTEWLYPACRTERELDEGSMHFALARSKSRRELSWWSQPARYLKGSFPLVVSLSQSQIWKVVDAHPTVVPVNKREIIVKLTWKSTMKTWDEIQSKGDK